MKIGIFGGAFNPPHTGHVYAAKKAIKNYKLDLLIVIPTGISPHKNLPINTPDPQIRFIMTENAFGDCENIEVSDIEINRPDISYTIDTVNAIKQKYPDNELYLLVGTDMYETLDTWKESDSLLKIVNPILLPRDDVKISSSEIREMLPQRKGREFLSDSNYSFIIKNKLYNAKPSWDWLREQAYSLLNPERTTHVAACEIAAVQLAERWGVDEEEAREAAILHDITKKLDFNENMCIIAKHGVTIGELDKGEEKLLHSITGAILAKHEFGVSDKVADAITGHTTGKPAMTMLDKIIYIADYIESTRVFPGIEDLRKVAFEDINKAMIIGLTMTADDLKSRGITPNTATYEALSDISGMASGKEYFSDETDKQ